MRKHPVLLAAFICFYCTAARVWAQTDAVSADDTDEYIDGSLRIFPLHRTYRLSLKDYAGNVADHLPLVARFVITVDDD